MDDICKTCLSLGRNMTVLTGTLRSSFLELVPCMLTAEAILICWECTAIVRKVASFKKRAQQSQLIFSDYLKENSRDLKMNSITSLVQSATNIIDILPNNIDFKNERESLSMTQGNETSPIQDIEDDSKVKVEYNCDSLDDNANLSDSEEPQKIESNEKVKVKLKRKVNKLKISAENESIEDIDFTKNKSERKKLQRTCKSGLLVDDSLVSVERHKHIRRRIRKAPELYKCKLCNAVFKTRGTYEYHKESHGEKPQCEECGRTFNSKSTLWTHRQLVHTDTKKYACEVCKKVFFTESGHAAHSAAHRHDERHFCTPCGKFFKSSSSFRKHQRNSVRHFDPAALKFGCPDCDRKFQTEARAKEHYDIIHLNMNKFSCSQCPRQYCTARALRIHVRIKHEHVEMPKDKVCELCGKGFRTSQVLKAHIRTHTGERPYVCARCPARFTQNGALHTHTRLVHLNLKRGKTKVSPPDQGKP